MDVLTNARVRGAAAAGVASVLFLRHAGSTEGACAHHCCWSSSPGALPAAQRSERRLPSSLSDVCQNYRAPVLQGASAGSSVLACWCWRPTNLQRLRCKQARPPPTPAPPQPSSTRRTQQQNPMRVATGGMIRRWAGQQHTAWPNNSAAPHQGAGCGAQVSGTHAGCKVAAVCA